MKTKSTDIRYRVVETYRDGYYVTWIFDTLEDVCKALSEIEDDVVSTMITKFETY